MRSTSATAAIALALALTGCGGGGGGGAAAVVTPEARQLDVSACLTQAVIPGRTVASLVVPDVLSLDLSRPNGFPNGRQLDDPVIDLELAALMLDLRAVSVDVLARRPLNPGGPDRVGNGLFPYFGEAWGGAPAAVGGSGFIFRTDAPSTYARVDRMGEPAVATILVRSPEKNNFNDDIPGNDATGKYVAEFTATLTALTAQLRDDFVALGLPPCSTN